MRRKVAPRAVWLPAAARSGMADEADARAPLETGGVLLGYVATVGDSVEAVVEDVVGPGPDALHGRSRFIPDGPWQRQHILRAFRDSGGVITYLGDWHTHPCGSGAASPLDLGTGRRIARRRRSRTRHPLVVIMHSPDELWDAAAYCYDRDELRPLRVWEC